MRTSHLGHYAVMLCLQKTQGDYNSRWSVLIAPFQSWWRTITKEFKTEGVTEECSNSPISVSTFLQNTIARGDYTMCSVQEHLTGAHSMIGDGTYRPVLVSYTVCGVLRNSLKKQIRFYHMLLLIGSMHPCSSPTNKMGIILLSSLSSLSSYEKWSEQCTLHTLHIICTPFPHISKLLVSVPPRTWNQCHWGLFSFLRSLSR